MMANPEHIEIVKGGRICIEEWRIVHGWSAELDLSHADLQGVSLKHADLRCANLTHANLNKATLQEANLEKAKLTRANLTFTNLLNANLSGADMEAALCKETNLNCSILDYAYLRRVVFLNAQLDFAHLRKTYLRYAVAKTSSFRGAVLRGTRFSQSDINDCDFRRADCSGADFSRSKIFRSRFMEANCVNAQFNMSLINNSDFTKADFTHANFGHTRVKKTHFLRANLRGANLDAIRMYGTETAEWDITAVRCRRFFTYSDGRWIRLPPRGKLALGEFEDRFKSRPTIEFIFQHGMNALAPAILGAAIDKANSEHPKAGLRILSIDARGGLPRAIIEIAQKVSKEDALALVTACYQQKIAEMHKELEGLRRDKESLFQVAFGKMLLPAIGTGTKFMSATELSEHFRVANRDALRGRLYRFRKKHKFDTNCFCELENRGVRQPQFLYNVRMVATIVEELRRKGASIKRPSRKK
jgi:uncharacterized protein YjbI with pentapeptide repeats